MLWYLLHLLWIRGWLIGRICRLDTSVTQGFWSASGPKHGQIHVQLQQTDWNLKKKTYCHILIYFSILFYCTVHSVWMWKSHMIQYLFLLLSSAHRHQNVCHLQLPSLDQKHEPACLWVRRMDTGHHGLHYIIHAKHEIQTPEKTIYFYRPLFTSAKWVCQVQHSPHDDGMMPLWLATKLLLKQVYIHGIGFYIIHDISLKSVFLFLWEWLNAFLNILYCCPFWNKRQTHYKSRIPPLCQHCGSVI